MDKTKRQANRRPVTLSLDTRTIELLAELAVAERRTKSAVVERALEQYVKAVKVV